jgi:hypothetical protein
LLLASISRAGRIELRQHESAPSLTEENLRRLFAPLHGSDPDRDVSAAGGIVRQE